MCVSREEGTDNAAQNFPIITGRSEESQRLEFINEVVLNIRVQFFADSTSANALVAITLYHEQNRLRSILKPDEDIGKKWKEGKGSIKRPVPLQAEPIHSDCSYQSPIFFSRV